MAMMSLAFAALAALTALAGAPAPRELCVARKAAMCFATLRAAVEAAEADDVIRVSGGRYEETLVIARPLTLIGAADGTTWLTGRITATRALTVEHFNIVGWVTTSAAYTFNHVRVGAAIAEPAPLPVIEPARDDFIAPPAYRPSPLPTPAPLPDVPAAFAVPEPVSVTAMDAPPPVAAQGAPEPWPWPAAFGAALVTLATGAFAGQAAGRRRRMSRAGEWRRALAIERRRAELERALRVPRAWVGLVAQIAADALGEPVTLDPEGPLVAVDWTPAPGFTVARADGRLINFSPSPRVGRGPRVARLADAGPTCSSDVQAVWLALARPGCDRARAALPAGARWYVVAEPRPAKRRR